MMSIAIQRFQVAFIVIVLPLLLVYAYIERDRISVPEMFLPSIPVVNIAGIPVNVEIVQTPEDRAKGLSGRSSIGRADGMLFIFPEPGYHAIWMKDMEFPIDVIWIDEDLTIISIDKNISPDTYPKTFRPERPARYAIETEPYLSDTYSFVAGMKVTLPVQLIDK